MFEPEQDPILKTAYLRARNSKHCDIRFHLMIETANGDSVNKEIIGICQSDHTLDVLKKVIQKEIMELNENNNKNNEANILLKLPGTLEEARVVFSMKEKYEEKFCRGTIKVNNFLEITAGKFLSVLDQKYEIIVNAPLVVLLRLPPVIYANFPVEPLTFKTNNLCRNATKFIWSKSLDKEVWDKVGEGYEYIVKKTDVSHYLKLCCVPYSDFKVKGPIVESISDHKVTLITGFPKCPFEDRHAFTTKKLKGNKLRVVSYNILADRYVDGVQFAYCPLLAQGIHYRKQLIYRELKGYNADIICLQEVDESHFKSYYKNQLKGNGFRTFFNRKGNCISEGLACAFRQNRFELLDYKHIVLRTALERKQFKDVLELMNLNREVKKEFLKQFTSLQSVVLKEKSTNKILVVGNTHLFYHPNANHIRLLQAFMTTLHLSNTRNRIMKEYNTKNVAVIFCGDFNSDVVKSLYGFMIRGTIDREHEDCLKISPSGEAILYHKFQLISACGTPKYTNYTCEYKGCLDYIFIERQHFSVSKVVPVPNEQELGAYVGLPNEFYPSDHLSLVVDLEFKSLR